MVTFMYHGYVNHRKKFLYYWQSGCTAMPDAYIDTLYWNLTARVLSHWGQVTHICVGNLIIIGSDSGLSPGWHQAIGWISPLGTSFNNILSEIDFRSRKSISKCRMENGGHFVQSSMCYVYGALDMVSTYTCAVWSIIDSIYGWWKHRHL